MISNMQNADLEHSLRKVEKFIYSYVLLSILRKQFPYIFVMYCNQQSNNLFLVRHDLHYSRFVSMNIPGRYFPCELWCYLILNIANILLYSLVANPWCTLQDVALVKKCFTNINNSSAEVSRLLFLVAMMTSNSRQNTETKNII